MGALLEDRVAAFVADHPGHTAREIALALRNREQSVREVLESGLFSHNDGPGQSKCWRLGSEPLPAAPRASLTHKQRVLRLLSDGHPHSYREGYRLGVMLHSRVADLRRDGHRIDCWRDGDDYLYRMVATLDPGRAADGESAPSRPGSSAAGPEPQNRPEHDSLPASGAPKLGGEARQSVRGANSQRLAAQSVGGRTESITPGPGTTAAEQLVLIAPEFRKAHAA